MNPTYWQAHNDLLFREEEASYLIRFLNQRVADKIRRGLSGSFVLNIDAAWGEGKTFFMKGLYADLKAANHPTIMIDAWRDDFSGDPLTAVIAEFDQFLKQFKSQDRAVTTRVRNAGKELRRNVGKLSVLVAKSAAKNLVKRVVGDGTDEIITTFKEVLPESEKLDIFVDDATGEVLAFTDANIDKFAEKQLERFNEAKNSLVSFHESLKHAVQALTIKDFKPPFFILVDELDRCRPTYAIEMLERIKHLFEVENVVFVLSTDTTQLANSIKAVYGNDFDSRHYLTRFFDRSYMLASPDRSNMIEWLYRNSNIDGTTVSTETENSIFTVVDEISRQFKLEIRQIEKAIDLLSTIATVWESDAAIEIALMFPMIAAFLTGNDLSDDIKIRSVFQVENSRNNFSHRHIKAMNIGAVFDQVNAQKRNTLQAIAKEITTQRSQNSHITDPTKTSYNILHAEYEARKSPKSTPLIATYAERVRMAGRISGPRSAE